MAKTTKIGNVGEPFICKDCKKTIIKIYKWQKQCCKCKIISVRKSNRETARKWREKHPEQALLKSREWVKNNHEKRLMQVKKYERKIGVIPRKEWAKSRRGANNNLWRGGTTENYPYQKEEWKKLIVMVWKRDSFKCQRCFVQLARGIVPQTHHIEPRRLGGSDSMENLITLCKSCHAKIEWEILSLRGRESWLTLPLQTITD